jgi:hypothetical protein
LEYRCGFERLGIEKQGPLLFEGKQFKFNPKIGERALAAP